MRLPQYIIMIVSSESVPTETTEQSIILIYIYTIKVISSQHPLSNTFLCSIVFHRLCVSIVRFIAFCTQTQGSGRDGE